MARQPIFAYTKGFLYRVWLTICALIIIATVAGSFLVYIQVDNQLKTHLKQRLLWEANLYRRQLDEVFFQAALKIDSLVRSPGAISVNGSLLQKEMALMQTQTPSIIRSWVAYPPRAREKNGPLILSPSTAFGYVEKLPWWREYISGKNPDAFTGFPIGRGQSFIGKPMIDQSNSTTLVPLLSFDLQGMQIIRAAGAQIDLNNALINNIGVDVDWSNIPVSVYTMDGVLVADPYRYYRGDLKLIYKPNHNPLIRQMLANSNEVNGFSIYVKEQQKMAGVYVKDPTLGLVLVIEYPAAQVVDPLQRIASGPLIIIALLLVIATIVIVTIYENTKRLRQVEQLARSAELRALQAHINPHFLFNTLDCLVGLAVSTGNASLVKMIRSLSHIFRYTIRKMDELVTVREELEYLSEYISLQQIRYGARFTFELSVPEELLDFKIFKFCIQPLVENCFIHGVEKSLDPVSIKVQIKKNGNNIEICVSDNGPGMATGWLREIKQSLGKETYESGSHGHGVGLSNIHHRLRYAYGIPYGLEIEPLEPGLAVHLKYPAIL